MKREWNVWPPSVKLSSAIFSSMDFVDFVDSVISIVFFLYLSVHIRQLLRAVGHRRP